MAGPAVADVPRHAAARPGNRRGEAGEREGTGLSSGTGLPRAVWDRTAGGLGGQEEQTLRQGPPASRGPREGRRGGREGRQDLSVRSAGRSWSARGGPGQRGEPGGGLHSGLQASPPACLPRAPVPMASSPRLLRLSASGCGVSSQNKGTHRPLGSPALGQGLRAGAQGGQQPLLLPKASTPLALLWHKPGGAEPVSWARLFSGNGPSGGQVWAGLATGAREGVELLGQVRGCRGFEGGVCVWGQTCSLG